MSTATLSAYLKAHEKLVLTLFFGAILYFAIGKVDALLAHHDSAVLQQAQVTLQSQQSKDAALAAQATQQAAQFQALAEKVQAQNAALEQANVTLSTALVKQQHTDTTLPPTELVARLNTLVPQASATVTPTGVALPLPGAVATVQQLELVPVQQQELVNARTQLGNTQGLLTASTEQVKTLTDEVSGLRLENVDEQKVCTAQVAEVKAEARKSKRRWFITGVIVGWVGRQLVKTGTGI
jgi:hypothetical protein